MMNGATAIDLDHLEKYVADDSALRDEILSIFSDQAELLSSQFDIFLPDEGWRDTAHALKGAARGVGAWLVGDLCEKAEALIGQVAGKSEKRAALLVSLRLQLSKALAEAARLREAA